MDRGAWRATVHAVAESVWTQATEPSELLLHKVATGSAFLQGPGFSFFPLSVHSLLFSIGVELISETVFVQMCRNLIQ